MSAGERKALVNAMEKVVKEGEFAKIASFHGLPYTMCDPFALPSDPADFTDGCCPHANYQFLPWHRLYVVQMELVSWVENKAL